MIEIAEFKDDQSNRVGHIVIRPNQSFTWRASKYFLLFLLILSTGIGVSFLLRGYWMILPFSIIEVTVVAACFYIILRRNRRQQVIEVFEDKIEVAEGIHQPEQLISWQRFFTKVVVTAPSHPWHGPAIKLRHRNEEIELGGFLNLEDKQALVKSLDSLIHLANQRQVMTP